MTVLRYECPRCQSVFVPVEPVSAGAYARCPNCAGLAVPAAGVTDETTAPLHLVPGAELPAPAVTRAEGVAGSGATSEVTLTAARAPPEPPAPLFASLMGFPVAAEPTADDGPPAAASPPDEATPAVAPPEPPAPGPETDGLQCEVQPAAGGLFSSLLASASDLELSGRRAPVVDRVPEPEPGPAQGWAVDAPLLDAGGAVPRQVTMEVPVLTNVPQSRIVTAEMTIPTGVLAPAPVSVPALAPVAAAETSTPSTPFEIANTGMLMGPADGPSGPDVLPPAAAAAAKVLSGLPMPPHSGGQYIEGQTFSDQEFEAMLGGTFAPGPAEPTGEHVLPDSWVVSNPGGPPPLKKARESQSLPTEAAPKPTAPTPSSLVAGLAPIPSVVSLGAAPRLTDGSSFLKVGGLLVSALLLGGLVGAALAPPPPRPPTVGPEGALHKLAEARRLLALGRNEEAASVLQTALVLDRNLAEAQRDLGVALSKLERWDEAARAYEGYLEMAPRAADAYQVDQSLKLFRAKGEGR